MRTPETEYFYNGCLHTECIDSDLSGSTKCDSWCVPLQVSESAEGET